MFFDDSAETINAFVQSVVNDVANLIVEVVGPSIPPLQVDKYRMMMAQLSQKVANRTNWLRCNSPPASSSESFNLLMRHDQFFKTASFREAATQLTDDDFPALINQRNNSCSVSVQTNLSLPLHDTDSQNSSNDNNDSISSLLANSYSSPTTTTLMKDDCCLLPPVAIECASNTSNNSESSLHNNSNKKCREKIAGPKRILRYEQTAVLKAVYQKQQFLSSEQRQKLASELDITGQQIKIWFQNRRFKDKRRMKQELCAIMDGDSR